MDIKSINSIFNYGNPHANLDSAYGPYTTLEEADLKTKLTRAIGLTVGIYTFKEDEYGEYILDEEKIPRTNNYYPIYRKDSTSEDKLRYSISGVMEYWWKNIKKLNDVPEKKIEDFEPTINANINSFYSINPGDSFDNISVEYNGGLRGLVNIYRNNSLIDSLPLNNGNNTIRLGQYNTYNEYNFTLNFSDIGGNPATVYNNSELQSSNEISFRLSVGTIIISDEFETYVNSKIINQTSTIVFPFKVQYINSQISQYTITAKLDNSIDLETITGISGNTLLLSYDLGNIQNLTIGSHNLHLSILDNGNVYETFHKEYTFEVVDVNTRGVSIEILNPSEIYSGKSLVIKTRLISGEEVYNVRLSYSYDNEHWINFNSTINFGETKTYSIIAPETTDPSGENFTVYVRWELAGCQTSLLFTVLPYVISVDTSSLEYNFSALGIVSLESDINYSWTNTGNKIEDNIEINNINALSNGFHNNILTLDGNFGVLKTNLFKNVTTVDKGFTLEFKYNTLCIGNLDALVLKNEVIQVSFDRVNINILSDNGLFSQSTSLSEDRWIHLTWVVDYDINNSDNIANIEDYLDFPASNIYINGSLCSSITLGNKSSNHIQLVINTLNLLRSAGTYFNCGSLYVLSDNEYVSLAQAHNIFTKKGTDYYYADHNLGSNNTNILSALQSYDLFNDVKQKVDLILNSENIGISNIEFFRFYNRPLKASEVYKNYKLGLSQQGNNDTNVPTVVFTTLDGEVALSIVNDLNNKHVLGYNSDGSPKYYADPQHFSNLLAMGQGEKDKQKTHFVYGRLLYYENGLDDNSPTKEFYTMTSTQGTSSLLYPVKNFKTTLCTFDAESRTYKTKLSDAGIYKLSKKKDNFEMEGWSEESKFTLKCDYMESAHFNNTPTCSFYNDIIDAENKFYVVDESTGTLVNKYNSEIEITNSNKYVFNEESKSPARKNGKFDAIKGFPCVVYALDNDPNNALVKNSCTNLTYLGTYMFNLDKSADSLGFEIKDNNIIDKYNPFPDEGGVKIALRFTYKNEIDGEKRLYQALEDMLKFDSSKCVDITDEIITQSYEGKANVRYSSGTFYSHSLYADFGYREYLLNIINIYNSIVSGEGISITEAESGKNPLDFYLLSQVSDFLETYLGPNSIQDSSPKRSVDPVYYLGDRDNNYVLDTTLDSTLTYTPIHLNNLKKWQDEDSEESYYLADYEDRWDYLLEQDKLANKFKDNNGKINWQHTWGDGVTWGWRRALNWIGELFSLNPSLEKKNFENYFNKDYCILYYLQMMVFGLVDNAGKNCMWDSWDGVIWYPRPYDLDSATGLNNSGLEDIPTYAEIAPELSPIGMSDSRGSIYPSFDTTNSRYKKYTTTTSKFWNNFGKVFNNEISIEYKKLRDSGIYNLDTILNYYTSLTSEKISPEFYNKDMVIKYIYNYPGSSEYYTRIHGNRIESFYLWMKGRLVFCDSLYGYDSIKALNLRQSANATNTTLSFEVYYPQYIHISIGSGLQVINLFCSSDSRFKIDNVERNGSAFTTSVIANDKETSIYGGPNIKRINGVLSLLDSLTFTNAEKLVELDVSNSVNLKSLSLTNCKYLLKLNASNCTRLNTTDIAIDLRNSRYLKEVNFSGCTCKLLEGKDFASVIFPENNNLQIVNFENSAVRSITLSNSSNLKIFNINGCDNLETLLLTNCNILDLNLLGYPLYHITLDSCGLLTSLNCSDTKYINTLNISNCNNLTTINFNGSSSPVLEEVVLTGAPHLTDLDFGASTSLKKLLLSHESIPTKFNVKTAVSFKLLNYGDLFDNLGEYVDCSNLYNVPNLSFDGCSSLTYVKKLGKSSKYYIKSSSEKLFNNCINLLKISDCYIKLTGTGAESMFSGALRFNNITDCNFDLNECTSLSKTFYNTDSLSWETIKTYFMDKLNDTDDINISLSGAFTYKNSVETSLPDGFFARCKNVNNMSSVFSHPILSTLSGLTSKSINAIGTRHFTKTTNVDGLTIREVIKLDKVKSLQSAFISNSDLTLIDDDFITTIFPNVENLNGTFALCSKLKIPDVTIFFKGLTLLTTAIGTFYSSGTSLNAEASSYTFTSLNNGFKTCSNLTKICDIFRGCSKLNLTINSTIIPKSVTVADNAFLGIGGLTFGQSLDSDIFEIKDSENSENRNNVYVGGMFGNCGLTSINPNLFNNINPIPNVRAESTILSGTSFSYGGNYPNADVGLFEGNSDLTISQDALEPLFLKLNRYSSVISFYKLFKDCTSLEVNTLDLHEFTKVTNMGYLFQNCYNLNLLYFNLPNTIININYMLSGAKISSLSPESVLNILKNKPNLTSAAGTFLGRKDYFLDGLVYKLTGDEFVGDTSLSVVEKLFSRSQLYGTAVKSKLFDYCRRSLTNVSNLFSYCTYLGLSLEDLSSIGLDMGITQSSFVSNNLTIEEDAEYEENDYEVLQGIRNVGDTKGLLSDCINLINTSSMFSQCYNLGGRIPKTIFAINNDVISYYTEEDEEVINGNAQVGDIKEQTDYKFDKLTSIARMFYNANINNNHTNNNSDILLVHEDTFRNIVGSNNGLNVSGLFAGVGARYIGNLNIINNYNNSIYGCKCLRSEVGNYNTGLKFIINFELFPNAKKITKMNYMFYNSTIKSVDGAFLGSVVSSVTDISNMFLYSGLSSLQTNFMLSNLSLSNSTLQKVNNTFYGCSLLAGNTEATIPDFGSNNYSKVSTKSTSCYTLTNRMERVGNHISNIAKPENSDATTQVETVLINNSNAWSKVDYIGYSNSDIYPIYVSAIDGV